MRDDEIVRFCRRIVAHDTMTAQERADYQFLLVSLLQERGIASSLNRHDVADLGAAIVDGLAIMRRATLRLVRDEAHHSCGEAAP